MPPAKTGLMSKLKTLFSSGRNDEDHAEGEESPAGENGQIRDKWTGIN